MLEHDLGGNVRSFIILLNVKCRPFIFAGCVILLPMNLFSFFRGCVVVTSSCVPSAVETRRVTGGSVFLFCMVLWPCLHKFMVKS